MSEAQVRNVLWYVAIAIAGALLATGVQFGGVLSGTAPIELRPLAATFVTTLFAALSTAAGTSFRPKAGREDISGLVSEVGAGPAKAALEVEAIKQATGVETTISDTDIGRLADAVLARRAEELRQRFPDAPPAEPALISKYPAWVEKARTP